MCLSTLFCANDGGSFLNLRFENDVKTYGTETPFFLLPMYMMFENDVKTYGTETVSSNVGFAYPFENDVKTYGTETSQQLANILKCLRMM